MKLFKRKKKDIFEEELVQSPGRTAAKNFFRRKLSLVGFGIFLSVVAFVFIASIFVPADFRHFDSTQTNITPGLNKLNLPAGLMNNARDIDFGSRFGVGIDNNGGLYMWGDLQDPIRRGLGWRPSRVLPADYNMVFNEMGPLRMISAGLDHVVAVEESGRVIAWGAATHMQTLEVPEHLHNRNIVDIRAGSWITMALCDEGNLTVWGQDATFWSPHRYADRNFAGDVEAFDMGTFSAIVLTKDGRVYAPTQGGGQIIGAAAVEETNDEEYDNNLLDDFLEDLLDGSLDDSLDDILDDLDLEEVTTAPGEVPHRVQGRAIDVAMTDSVYAALLDDGTVVTWTNAPNPIRRDAVALLPDDHPIQGRVTQIEAGRWHFSALLDDGSVYAWGFNHLGQIDFPEGTSGNVRLHTGYFQNAVVNGTGQVTTWGNNGYLMGTDEMGRDVFARVIHGGRITFTIGFVAVIIASIIGIILGGIAGYFGKLPDMLIMRIAEVVESIPFLPLVLIMAAVVPRVFPDITEMQRIMMIMIILGIITWTGFCRQTRAQVLQMKDQEFVVSAHAMGIRNSGIIFRHIMPNALSIVLVSITLSLATSLLIESTLSFLGFGVVPPTPTWGNMIHSARDAVTLVNQWWRWLFAALFLGLSTVSIGVMGDGLRDALDPRVSGGR